MKRKIVANEGMVNRQQLRSAKVAMQKLLDIMDSMNEDTYAVFQETVGGRIYTEIADGIPGLDFYLYKE